MSKPTNTTLHYKMYKSGKSWACAGIISASLLLAGGGVVAQADTTTADSTTPTETTPNTTQPSESEPTVLPKTPTPKPTAPDDTKAESAPITDPQAPEVTNPDTKPANPIAKEENPVEDTTVHTPAVPVTKPAAKPTEKNTPTQSPLPVPQTTPKPVAAITPLAAPSNESIDTWMPNKILQNMVAMALNKDVSQITTSDLANLTELKTKHIIGSTTFVDGRTPFSLKGLQYATNLTTLDLSYDNQLDYIHLQNSPNGSGRLGDIVDLTPLSSLKNLTILNVAYNKITNLSPLAGLKNLVNLDVSHNMIGDFSMLDASQFKTLQISNQIFVVDFTKQEFIDLKNRKITIAQPLKLPQNYGTKLKMPFIGFGDEDKFSMVSIMVQQIHSSSSDGHGVFLLFGSGNLQTNYQLEPNGSLSFSKIKPQQTYYYGGTYADYPNSVGTPTPGNHKYYLRADLKDDLKDVFTILIPYADAKAAAPITVHYRDVTDDTTPIKPDLVFGTDKIAGNTYTLTPEQLAVDGYTYDDTRNQNAAITGKLSDQTQTITLYYTKDATKPVTPVTPPVTPATTVTVTVHYQDGQGHQLLPDARLTGQPGTTYQVNIPVIKGYQLDTANTPTGTFGDRDQDIVVTYHAVASNGHGATITPGTDTAKQPDLVTPDKPQATAVNVTTHGQAAQLSPKKTQRVSGTRTPSSHQTTRTNLSASSPAKQTLPQTNTHRTSPIAGLALLLGTLIGFGWSRKRNEH